MSLNLMWGLLPLAEPRTLKLLRVLQVLGKIKQPAKFQHRVMQLCGTFDVGLPLVEMDVIAPLGQ